MKRVFLWASALALLAPGCADSSTVCTYDNINEVSCIALKLTGSIDSKIDSLYVFYEINAVDEGIFTTRYDQSLHAAAGLPIEVPIVIPLNAPFTDPLIRALVFANFNNSVVGVTSFAMNPPQTGKFSVTAPLSRPETSRCFNGVLDLGETDLDCGWEGTTDLNIRGFSANVLPVRDFCFPCQSGSKCLFNPDCYSRSCNNNTLTCD